MLRRNMAWQSIKGVTPPPPLQATPKAQVTWDGAQVTPQSAQVTPKPYPGHANATPQSHPNAAKSHPSHIPERPSHNQLAFLKCRLIQSHTPKP